MAKLLRKSYENHKDQFLNQNNFLSQNSILRHYPFKMLKVVFTFEFTR